ncbi:AmmeMemoRadiSam system protein A [Marichromatium bheemlicum]|nr:AmmeMemoRadiSam system protein A [Marichromatium bheemlicum]
MPSTDSTLDASSRDLLLRLALQAIDHGLERGTRLTPDPARYPLPLRAVGACFVTLEHAGALRGCVGTLEPHRALVCDVAANAFAAAFDDPRFTPLCDTELGGLHLEVSVLSSREAIDCANEAACCAALRPGIDGVVLRAGRRRATFLPAVWAQLPEPVAFLAALRVKAGLDPEHWPPELRLERYTTEHFGATVAALRQPLEPGS